jgi:hypothetical protein
LRGKDPDENEEEEKKKEMEGLDEEESQSKFKQETDPSKLGKNLSDKITRIVIIGILLMLMVLPLLSPTSIDYSHLYGLREIFTFGRSSC